MFLDTLRSLACKSELHILLIFSVASSCFYRTLGSYFIADDFPEIAYAASIFHGRADLFLTNFTGNYMQVPGMSVYRPGTFLTMVSDYLLYGTKTWGYLLTNFLYYAGDAALLYYLCLALTASWNPLNSMLFALFSALFFAVNPLHCETISWVVGRGDPISCFPYLLSLLLFAHAIKRTKARIFLLAASVASFVVALSVKEMPVALPALLTVLALCWTDSVSVVTRFQSAFRLTLPYWITVAIYFLIRYLCLGTMGGGYVGGIGAQQLAEMFQHWTDLDTIRRLFLPVSTVIASQSALSLTMLSILNVTAFSLAVLRVLAGCWSLQWLCLMGAFFITTALPVFQLWGLGPNLEGGRFYYYLSLPLSMLLPLMFFHPAAEKLHGTAGERASAAINAGSSGRAMTVLSIIVQVSLIILLQRTTAKTNMLWVHAGKENLHISQQCQKLATETDKKKRMLLLGIPDDYYGAHLILNRCTFDLMLRPPFTGEDFAQHFLTTMPTVFGPEQYVNGSRVRFLLSEPDVIGPYIWRRDTENFQRVDLSANRAPDENVMVVSPGNLTKFVRADRHSNDRYSIFLDDLDVDPLSLSTMQVDFEANGISSENMRVYWNGAEAARSGFACASAETKHDFRAESPLSNLDGLQTVTLRLGHYWRWYACGKIKSLELSFPYAESIRVRAIRLLPDSMVAPLLTFSSGDRFFADSGSGDKVLMLDKRKVNGACSMQLEIGKPNFFFDNFYGRKDDDAVAFRVPLPGGEKTVSLVDLYKYFPSPGYYQVRLRCLDRSGAVVGSCSDAVTLLR